MTVPSSPSEKQSTLGPYVPTLILHGGAGSISRATLPPELYARYHASLLEYLTKTRDLLVSGATALDAACYAVTLFEDDPLFNCGRGAVFTDQGTIEMEASVMVCSVNPAGPPAGSIKRGAAVSLVRNTRHPILLAKEVLVAADDSGGLGGTNSMHCHLSGRKLEEWGWKEKQLESKPDQWFWTKKRWEEHRRGLRPKPSDSYTFNDLLASVDPFSPPPHDDELGDLDVNEIPSQGTVGAVCLDSWGNLAVATSTGGLTNKKAGRIGDTPTIGSGFWAESWEEDVPASAETYPGCQPGTFDLATDSFVKRIWTGASDWLRPCLSLFEAQRGYRLLRLCDSPPPYSSLDATTHGPYNPPYPPIAAIRKRHRAVAMSGTGNGDSFLRTNAVRTAASICRFSSLSSHSLADAVATIAGPNGELQRSAGDRWGRTGEGQGGIIGIEVIDCNYGDETEEADVDWSKNSIVRKEKKKAGKAVFDFNCGGMFRAYYEAGGNGDGDERAMVMVFKEEY